MMRSKKLTWAVLGLSLPFVGCSSPAGKATCAGFFGGLVAGGLTYACTGSVEKSLAAGTAAAIGAGAITYMWAKRQAMMEERRAAELRFMELQARNAALQAELAQARSRTALVPVRQTPQQTVFVEVDTRTGQAGPTAHTLPNDQATALAQESAQNGGKTSVRMDDGEYVVLWDQFATA